MNIEGKELKRVEQALQYGAMHSRDESETAGFALLLIDVTGELERERIRDEYIAEHAKQGCAFMYCSQKPKCKQGECVNKTSK